MPVPHTQAWRKRVKHQNKELIYKNVWRWKHTFSPTKRIRQQLKAQRQATLRQPLTAALPPKYQPFKPT